MVLLLTVRILPIILISLSEARGKVRTMKEEIKLFQNFQENYKGCNEVGSGKVCFGVPDSSCWTTGTCTQGIILQENKTHISITKFQAEGQNVFKESSVGTYSYAYGISVDPFENNGMATSKPICKKQLNSTDFIVRIFRWLKKPNPATGLQDQKNSTESIFLVKSEWEKVCKEDVVKEYNSLINTFDTRYIVFQNKFYFDIDIKKLISYQIPISIIEDFKDPDFYFTRDGKLYLNFIPESNGNGNNSNFGVSKSHPGQVPMSSVIDLLQILLFLSGCYFL